MFLNTKLVFEIIRGLKEINSWPSLFYRTSYPYQLRQDATSSAGYAFRVTPGFQEKRWKTPILPHIIVSLSVLYKAIMEKTPFVAKIMTWMSVVNTGLIGWTSFLDHRYAQLSVNLMNELLEYEARYKTILTLNGEGNARRVIIASRIVRWMLTAFGLATVLSCTITPESLWGYLPNFATKDYFSEMDINSYLKLTLQILRRIWIFWYHYVFFRDDMNQLIQGLNLVLLYTCFSFNYAFIAILNLLKKKVKEEDVFTAVSMLTQLQILIKIFNDINKIGVCLAFLLSPVLTPVAYATVALLKADELNHVTLLSLGNGILICFIWLFIYFHYPMKIFVTNSDIFLTTPWGRNAHIFRNLRPHSRSTLQRKWRSFPVQKIFFFSSNFFEDLTQLVMLDFVVNNTVSMVLMGKELG